MLIKDPKGYTSIELILVVMLIGLMITLTIPRFRSAILSDDLKATTRRIVGTIKDLGNEAIREHTAYILHFDLESNRFWFDSSDMTEEEQALARKNASSIPPEVSITDVLFKDDKKMVSGEITIRFTRKGYVQQSIIHLGSKDGRVFSIVLSPFLRRVKVMENYIDLEDI